MQYKFLGFISLAALASGVLLSACGDSASGSNAVDDKFNAFTDKRDGNVYRVVTIGNQTWMAENLRYDPLDSLVNGKYWCVSHEPGESCENGNLYDFYAVMNDSACDKNGCDVIYPHRGICPEGFHVPENYEWRELTEKAFLLGLSLGAASEFNAEPTGEYNYHISKIYEDDYARYWTSTPRRGEGAFEWFIAMGDETLQNQIYVPDYGYALRCVAAAGEVKLDTFVEFVVPEPVTPVARSSSSRVAYSSSSAGDPEIERSYVNEGGLNAFTDKRDGNVYRVLSVGPQIWMVENLRYSDSVASPVLKGRSWCIGEGDDCGKEGYLYNFAAVVDDPECADSFCSLAELHRGICPEGWHVPSADEWEHLLTEAASRGISLNSELGFPSSPTGEHGGYTKMDDCARYWTASQANYAAAYEYYRCGERTQFESQNYDKSFGYALRCVADPGEVKLDKYIIPDDPFSRSSSSEGSSSSEVSSSSEESSSSEPPAESSSSEGYVFHDDLETFTDERDGEVYTQVTVGTQVWMAENLRYADSAATPALKGSTFCWEDDPENCKTRGALYLWSAAMGKAEAECGYDQDCEMEAPHRGICPDGFHVPTSSEWYDLRQYASDSEKELFDIPTGEVDTRYDKSFASESAAHYWTSSEVNAQGAVTWYISNHDISSQDFDKRMGYALRCIKDAEYSPE